MAERGGEGVETGSYGRSAQTAGEARIPKRGGGRYPLEPSTPNPILHLLCSSQALVAAALSGAGRRLPGLGAGTTETVFGSCRSASLGGSTGVLISSMN